MVEDQEGHGWLSDPKPEQERSKPEQERSQPEPMPEDNPEEKKQSQDHAGSGKRRCTGFRILKCLDRLIAQVRV